MKMVVSYLNFVFFIEVKAKSKYRILNFVFQFIKKTKWHFGYTDLPSFVLDFPKKMENRNTARFSFFVFKKELKNELLKQITINFMIVFISILYNLFKSKFVSSPLRFSAVQGSRGH